MKLRKIKIRVMKEYTARKNHGQPLMVFPGRCGLTIYRLLGFTTIDEVVFEIIYCIDELPTTYVVVFVHNPLQCTTRNVHILSFNKTCYWKLTAYVETSFSQYQMCMETLVNEE